MFLIIFSQFVSAILLSLVFLCFFTDIHGLYEGPVTEVEAPAEVEITEEATDADAVTVKEAPSSGTAAVVSLSVIASALTLTALEM